MKTIKALFFATIVLCTIYSCKKVSSTAGGGTWTATINGKQQSGYTTAGYQTEGNTLTVTMAPAKGVFYPNLSLSIVSTNPITAGTYPLSNSFFGAFGEYTADSSDTYLSFTGQWNLSTLNYTTNTIQGTFNFSGFDPNNGDTLVVTNGSFSDSYLVGYDN